MKMKKIDIGRSDGFLQAIRPFFLFMGKVPKRAFLRIISFSVIFGKSDDFDLENIFFLLCIPTRFFLCFPLSTTQIRPKHEIILNSVQ